MTTNTKEQWKNNNCLIYAYKSHRKNAKIISSVTMRHLITQNDNGCLSEEHILQYFIGVVGQLVTDIRFSANRTINISTYTSIDHMTTYTNANSELYSRNHTIRFNSQRIKFASIEQFINYLYDLLLLIYPYTRLDINTVYGNASIRYWIDLYYNR